MLTSVMKIIQHAVMITTRLIYNIIQKGIIITKSGMETDLRASYHVEINSTFKL